MRLRKKSMNLNFTQFHVIYLRANLHLLSTIMYSTFLLPPVNSTRVRQFNFSFHSPHGVCSSILQILIEKNLFSLSMEMQATSRNANVRCWHPQEFFKHFPTAISNENVMGIFPKIVFTKSSKRCLDFRQILWFNVFSRSNVFSSVFVVVEKEVKWVFQLVQMTLNNCNWYSGRPVVDRLNVVLSDHPKLDLDLRLSFLTFCRKLCRLSAQKRTAKQKVKVQSEWGH